MVPSRGLILANLDFYAKTIKKAGNDADSFKAKIKDLCKSQPSEELNKFAVLIGVEIKEFEK